MSSPPSELFLNSQLTSKRLGEVFAPTRDLDCDNRSLAINGGELVTIDQGDALKLQRPAQDLTHSRRIFRAPPRNQRQPKRSDPTESDMTASCFALTLLLIATIVAAYADRPVFWLLLGPVPLAAGIAMIAFFQQRLGRRSLFFVAGRRDSSRG